MSTQAAKRKTQQLIKDGWFLSPALDNFWWACKETFSTPTVLGTHVQHGAGMEVRAHVAGLGPVPLPCGSQAMRSVGRCLYPMSHLTNPRRIFTHQRCKHIEYAKNYTFQVSLHVSGLFFQTRSYVVPAAHFIFFKKG